ncbi:carbonate dehydratase [Ascidiimonas aurantiaca]|uniref:carbonate dehydratase n=1 Tax=Ascidiimonas aurantiaca TaxID=1685432 RepID=UPI0030EC2054
MSDFYKRLLDNNKEWVAQKTKEDPEYFIKMAKGQKPPLLWIGCADSRVPANEITGTRPGEVFVHRNIANVVVHTDLNMLSVLEYAVNTLEVQHIIVCGHYGCGGIQAAMGHKSLGLINKWVRHVKDVYRIHKEELEAIEDKEHRFDRLVELNVQEQLLDLAETSIVQKAWKTGRGLQLHGWVYNLSTGLVKDLELTYKDNSTLPDIYKLDL